MISRSWFVVLLVLFTKIRRNRERQLKDTLDLTRLLVAAAVGAGSLLLPAGAAANPQGGKVVAGIATIKVESATKLGVTQHTDKAIVNWQSFDINVDEHTQFYQPGADSTILNRIVGHDPSEILGRLSSNGRVVLVNPDGILFGNGARVDVGGLIATTNDIGNKNFMDGNLAFDITGSPYASVINEGTINIKNAGIAALVAPGVRNSGVIVAKLGSVALASASGYTLDFRGSELIQFLIDGKVNGYVLDADGNPLGALVNNTGEIRADAGYVILTAHAARNAVNNVVNNSGVIEAASVAEKNGEIVLHGGNTGTVVVTGTLNASGNDQGEAGGIVQVTGEKVALLGGAHINVSGPTAGGTVLVGGDYLGGAGDPNALRPYGTTLEDKEIPTARYTYMDAGATISADATMNGKGGKVILWSDEGTRVYGEISAMGGAVSGDGGFVETSGRFLDVVSRLNLSAVNGKNGTWLLDPEDISIVGSGDNDYDTDYSYSYEMTSGIDVFGTGFIPDDDEAEISADTIEAQLNSGTNVVIDALNSSGSDDGDIRLKTNITKSYGGNASLHLLAGDDILISRGVDLRSYSGAMSVVLFAPYGRINADDIDRVSLNGGTFYLSARDGIDLDSPYDMPDDMVVVINELNESSILGVVDIDFDEDQVRFYYDDDKATVPTGGISLTDRTSNGGATIYFNLPVGLEDLAIVGDSDRYWRTYTRGHGTVKGDDLNGLPEIVGWPDVWWTSSREPGNSIVPIFEVSHDFNNTVDDLIPSSPRGYDLEAAYESSKTPKQVVDQAEREIIPNPNQYSEPAGPVQPIYESTTYPAQDVTAASPSPIMNLSYGKTKGTVKFSTGGELRSYSNMQLINGKYTEGSTKGDYQCVELIQRYAGSYTGKEVIKGLGHGKDVAKNLPGKTNGAFIYQSNGSPIKPGLGSVISINLSGDLEPYGHVGIIQAIESKGDTVNMTLFDQNWPTDISKGWKIVTFTQQADGGWLGTMMNNGKPMKVVGWANPKQDM